MPNRFDQFLHDENLKLLHQQIKSETDGRSETDVQRLMLLKTRLREEQIRVVVGIPRNPK